MASSITFKDTNTNKTDNFKLISGYTVTTPKYDYNGNLAWEKVLNIKQYDGTVFKLPLTKSSSFSESSKTKFKFNNTNYYIATWWFPKEINVDSTYYNIASSHGSGYYYMFGCNIYGPDNVTTDYNIKQQNRVVSFNFKLDSGLSNSSYPNDQTVGRILDADSSRKYYRLMDGYASYNFQRYTSTGNEYYFGNITVTWIWNGITYRKEAGHYTFGKSAES